MDQREECSFTWYFQNGAKAFYQRRKLSDTILNRKVKNFTRCITKKIIKWILISKLVTVKSLGNRVFVSKRRVKRNINRSQHELAGRQSCNTWQELESGSKEKSSKESCWSEFLRKWAGNSTIWLRYWATGKLQVWIQATSIRLKWWSQN